MSYPRPLSPHLQIYKPQLTSMLSVLHRLTGIVLAAGIFSFVYWIAAIALGESAFVQARQQFGSWYGQIALFKWSLCFFYHLCNGIRHLVWDAGFGFELPAVYRSGWFVLCGSIGITVCMWGYIYFYFI